MNAKEHYQDVYHLQIAPSPENYWLYGYIGALGIRNVFEFGCNAGRHLHQLQRMGLEVHGIDVNERAIEAASLYHKLALHVGDERSLSKFSSDSFDVVLTVSVLSHMENEKPVLQELRRIARKHLILVETRSRTDSGNYWWRHDYPGRRQFSYYAKQVNAMYEIWHVKTG